MPSQAATLADALTTAANRGTGELVFHLGDAPEALPLGLLAERAEWAAAALVERGIEPGSRVGILGRNRPEWISWTFGTWLAGATVVPIQLPLRIRRPESFAEQVRSLAQAAECRAVVVSPELASHVPEDLALRWDTRPSSSTSVPSQGPEPDDIAVIQFTSGSTAAPKGAMVTHRAAIAHMGVLDRAYDIPHSENVRIAWSPFFHDLGLVKDLIYGVCAGVETHFLPTDRFVRNAGELLRLAGRVRATSVTGPSSVWRAAVRSVERDAAPIDLSALRLAWFGAEPVDPDAADAVVAACPKLGIDPAALGSTYGLAEAVLGVCVQHGGLREEKISLDALRNDHCAVPAGDGPQRRIYSAGPPIEGVSIRIKNDELLDERQVGEIQVKSPSLMTGYVGAVDEQPFDEDWLRTGDLGYVAEGELYVTGRQKDMTIVMGQNYYPEDFEWAASTMDGVRDGLAVAFSRPDAEAIVVVVESRRHSEIEKLCDEIRQRIKDEVGVAPAEVAVVRRGSIKRTTSGKLRRNAMRDAYLRNELEVLAHT